MMRKITSILSRRRRLVKMATVKKSSKKKGSNCDCGSDGLPERLVLHVDTGSMPTAKVKCAVRKLMKIYNPDNGKIKVASR